MNSIRSASNYSSDRFYLSLTGHPQCGHGQGLVVTEVHLTLLSPHSVMDVSSLIIVPIIYIQ